MDCRLYAVWTRKASWAGQILLQIKSSFSMDFTSHYTNMKIMNIEKEKVKPICIDSQVGWDFYLSAWKGDTLWEWDLVLFFLIQMWEEIYDLRSWTWHMILTLLFNFILTIHHGSSISVVSSLWDFPSFWTLAMKQLGITICSSAHILHGRLFTMRILSQSSIVGMVRVWTRWIVWIRTSKVASAHVSHDAWISYRFSI